MAFFHLDRGGEWETEICLRYLDLDDEMGIPIVAWAWEVESQQVPRHPSS